MKKTLTKCIIWIFVLLMMVQTVACNSQSGVETEGQTGVVDDSQTETKQETLKESDTKKENATKPQESIAQTDKVTESDTEAEPEEPATPFVSNTFSPLSEKAGKAYVNVSNVQAYSTSMSLTKFCLDQKNNQVLPFSVACYISDTEITAMLPSGVDRTALIPSYSGGCTIYLDGERIDSNITPMDLSQPCKIEVKNFKGVIKEVTLNVECLSTGLPSVAVSTSGFQGINSKTNYVTGDFYVGGGNLSICPYGERTQIYAEASFKGRGNTSWGFPKKGYTIKLSTKENVLGMGYSKDWTLISNYQDKTLMRNEIASHLSEMFGGIVTMKTRSVDLWLDGQYNGTYLVIEKVEIESGRINIPKYEQGMQPNELGYLLEWDGHVQEIPELQKSKWQDFGGAIYDPTAGIIIMNNPGWIEIHKPSVNNMTEKEVSYIVHLVQDADAAIKSRDINEIKKYIDIRSFAAWYLVEDIMKNMDACFWSSCYMYADGNGIIHMGPVWDFDMSLGNANYGSCDNPSGQYIGGTSWMSNLFKTKEFCEMVQALLDSNKDKLDGMTNYMSDYADMLEIAQKYNFEKWDILGHGVGANPSDVINAKTYDAQIKVMQNFYVKRLAFVRDYVKTAYSRAFGIPETPSGGSEGPGEYTLPKGGTVLSTGLKETSNNRSLHVDFDFGPEKDLSAYAKDGVVCMTYQIDHASSITDGQFEITSSGTCDKNEATFSLSSDNLESGGWKRIYFKVSEAGQSGGQVDWSAVNYMRLYIHVNQQNTFRFADVRIYHESELKQ